MFCFWDREYDKLVPMMSNANYHPKSNLVENNVFPKLGRGNWNTCVKKIVEGLGWAKSPWELLVNKANGKAKSSKIFSKDFVKAESRVFCGSSTDLSILNGRLFDLVITDPPFGNLLYYADLADFFYVWLRIPLSKWYAGQPEEAYFTGSRTPHAMEAITNPAEHPDDRENWEKDPRIKKKHLDIVRRISGNQALQKNDPNPLYLPEPAAEFYRQTLTACWAEAGRLLKPSGLMAFTFHHSEDEPWLDVLESLFNAGYILVATYPIRSDETKGKHGAFGSRKIEYDIIHVCRKQLEEPKPVSWSRMRRWVKKEAQRLKELLEVSHSKALTEADLLVILRGKGLEFYSRHYGEVHTGDDQIMSVRDALLGINQLLEDLIENVAENGRERPPDAAEPASRLFLRIWQGRKTMKRDELHKTLRGTGYSPDEFEARGWLSITGTTVTMTPIRERFRYFTAPGRSRKILTSDLDQAHFLIGAALPKSGMDISQELNRDTFVLKKSVEAILKWHAETDSNTMIRNAAKLALDLVTHWLTQKESTTSPVAKQMSLFAQLEAEE